MFGPIVRTVTAAAVAACVLAGWTVSAQQVRGVEPKPLAASDPQAQRAAEIVKVMLTGDKADVIKKLKAESDPSFVDGKDFETVLDRQMARLAKAKYTIRDFQTGLGADVVVNLQTPGGEDSNIVIRFNDAKRVVGFAQVQMAGGN
jgi:hypothetical protein